MINPYQAPKVSESARAPIQESGVSIYHLYAFRLIYLLVILTTAVGFIGIFNRTVGDWIQPRFGGMSLILTMNIVVPMIGAFRRPTRVALFGGAFVSFSLVVINYMYYSQVSKLGRNDFDPHALFFMTIPFILVGLSLIGLTFGSRFPWVLAPMPQTNRDA